MSDAGLDTLVMDLNTITDVLRPANADSIKEWQSGYAWLAGGTWLFSEPQIATHTLIDLESFKWPSLVTLPEGLEIAATCKVAELDRFTAPPQWKGAPLFRECCRAFLASFKILNEATVGGNIVMSLPAGPMISLTAALEGICTLWPRSGPPRQVPVADFVTGNHENVLAPGELLRSIFLPASALRKSYAFRQLHSYSFGTLRSFADRHSLPGPRGISPDCYCLYAPTGPAALREGALRGNPEERPGRRRAFRSLPR